MTLADLQRAAELLAHGSSITLPRDALLAAIKSSERENPPAPHEAPDRLISAAEVARRMGVKRKHVYQHADEWPFTRRLGAKVLRFEEKGFERWLARQR